VFGDFFVKQPTVETAIGKAERLDGWSVEQAGTGYTVRGVDANGQPSSWQYEADEVDNMNYLLDHVGSVKIGDEYRRQKWGLQPGEVDTSAEWCERKHEIREYRSKTYDEQEYKPGWKRLLGL
jgi:hypothetical protein